jgi:hypothetical protein
LVSTTTVKSKNIKGLVKFLRDIMTIIQKIAETGDFGFANPNRVADNIL